MRREGRREAEKRWVEMTLTSEDEGVVSLSLSVSYLFLCFALLSTSAPMTETAGPRAPCPAEPSAPPPEVGVMKMIEYCVLLFSMIKYYTFSGLRRRKRTVCTYSVYVQCVRAVCTDSAHVPCSTLRDIYSADR